MFAFFERLIDPYPPPDGRAPPAKLFAFLYYYSRPVLPWMLVMAVLTGALSMLEILFFSFTGDLVDWLAKADPATFIAENAWTLAAMGAQVLQGRHAGRRSPEGQGHAVEDAAQGPVSQVPALGQGVPSVAQGRRVHGPHRCCRL